MQCLPAKDLAAGRGIFDAAARAGLTARAVEWGSLKLARQVRLRVPNLFGQYRGDKMKRLRTAGLTAYKVVF